jgi:hypothetical protein
MDIGNPPFWAPYGTRQVYTIYILPYVPEAVWLLKPRLAFEASTDPVYTSAQAALAPHPTMEQEESSYGSICRPIYRYYTKSA